MLKQAFWKLSHGHSLSASVSDICALYSRFIAPRMGCNSNIEKAKWVAEIVKISPLLGPEFQ